MDHFPVAASSLAIGVLAGYLIYKYSHDSGRSVPAHRPLYVEPPYHDYPEIAPEPMSQPLYHQQMQQQMLQRQQQMPRPPSYPQPNQRRPSMPTQLQQQQQQQQPSPAVLPFPQDDQLTKIAEARRQNPELQAPAPPLMRGDEEMTPEQMEAYARMVQERNARAHHGRRGSRAKQGASFQVGNSLNF